MYQISLKTDLSHLGVQSSTMVQIQFQFNFLHHSLILVPVQSNSLIFLQEAQIPAEATQNFTVQLSVRAYRGQILQQSTFYTSEHISLAEQRTELLLAEDLNLDITIVRSDKYAQFTTLPNLLVQLPFQVQLTVQIQCNFYAFETELVACGDSLFAVNRSVIIPFQTSFRVCIFSTPRGQMKMKVASFSVTYIEAHSQLITLNFAAKFSEEMVAQATNSQMFACMGLIEVNDGFQEFLPEEKVINKNYKSIKKLKKIDDVQGQMRIIVNNTNLLHKVNIAKIENYAEQQLTGSAMLYNFEPCTYLANSWLNLQNSDQKVQNKVYRIQSMGTLNLKSFDYSGVVAFYRQGGQIYNSIPQYYDFGVEVRVANRLQNILSQQLFIIVVLNEKQFFRLPIDLQEYKESVYNSILNNNLYKIILEVKFQEVQLDLTFNFQIFDQELKQYLVEKDEHTHRQMREIQKIEEERQKDLDELQKGMQDIAGDEYEKKRKRKRVKKIGHTCEDHPSSSQTVCTLPEMSSPSNF
uniref:Uncharacterized protein n=1 Tax=Spironucleus salmonicida TaxID=348837 RepID=V6LSK0_9EUKA|eukprot:EST47585.1 Hypothetical protein SS50377_12276 [Spironucleus salmonicida]